VAWVAHIVIYSLASPPLSPFLNEVFIKLDDVWGMSSEAMSFVNQFPPSFFASRIIFLTLLLLIEPGLLGTAAFAFFCFYLLVAVIAGAMMLGLKSSFYNHSPNEVIT